MTNAANENTDSISMPDRERELQIRVWSLEWSLREAKEALPDLQQQLRLLNRARKRTACLNRLACRLTKEIAHHGSLYPCEEMPGVPDPVCKVADTMVLPDEPGIYFVWSERKVMYVGQSGRLSQRVTTRHDRIKRDDWVSFLLFPFDDLTFFECYYIWRCKPERNFGSTKKRVHADLHAAMLK